MDGVAKKPHAAKETRLPQGINRTPMTVSYNERRSTSESGSTSLEPGGESADGGHDREARNTAWLEAYQIVVRIGWIFKTETIIMPAVLDAVVDSAGSAIPGISDALVANRVPQDMADSIQADASDAFTDGAKLAAWSAAGFLLLGFASTFNLGARTESKPKAKTKVSK